MTYKKRQRKKRYKRKYRKSQSDRNKQLMLAYLLHVILIFLSGLMIILMVCGCLYIYDHLFKKGSREAGTYSGADANQEGASAGNGRKGDVYTVVLDPGHGGKDGGTDEAAAAEKEINLAVALRMKKWLEGEGVYVILTRDSDAYVGLDERIEMANEEQADLFVSIHCNYYDKDSSIKGLECYYAEDSERGKHYADEIVAELTKRANVTVRDVKIGDYHVLRNAEVPAILVEMGYLSNYDERTKLQSSDYQELIAIDLVNGIVQGLESVS